MMQHPFTKATAALLMLAVIAPSVMFIAPQRTHAGFLGGAAQIPILTAILGQDTITALNSAYTFIKTTLIEVHAWTTAVATVALYINMYVLQPLAFILSGRLMQSITAGVVGFINGTANAVGAPQFTQSIAMMLQRLGDVQAMAFFSQYNSYYSNSSFKDAVVGALRRNYLQGTTVAGFFARNLNTLPYYSSNQAAFLNGNWMQGGIAAWFALTTQAGNNPYLMYQNSQSQLAAMLGAGAGGITGARLAELGWGNGFMSWCGGDPSQKNAALPPGTPGSTQQGPPAPTIITSPGDYDQLLANATVASHQGVKLGDPCTKADGTPGTILTPGSTIQNSLNKVLGGTQDKLAQMGQLANEVTGILTNIGIVLGTVDLAFNILKGPTSGGLAGTATTYNPDRNAVFGVTSATVQQTANAAPGLFDHSNANTGAGMTPPAGTGSGGTGGTGTPLTVSPSAVTNTNCTDATFQFQVQGGTPSYDVGTTGGVVDPGIVSASGDTITLTGLVTGSGVTTIALRDSSSPQAITTATVTCNQP